MRSFLALGVLGLLLATLLATGTRGAAVAQADTLQEQIDRAAPGDTLIIEGGIYNESVLIDKPLTLEGRDWPVIDGGGTGDVVTITADDVTLSRFVIRNSAHAVSQEPAAIKVKGAHSPIIRSNRIENAHFGIHVTDTHHAEISYNEIDIGEDVSIERRGHGIYLWETHETAIHANTVTRAGDGIHLEFSDDNGIGQNIVTNSRYALHFMSSENNRILENKLSDNLSGALLMFSSDLLVKGNEFNNNRKGASGAGMLLKDVDNIFVDGNQFIRNKYGLTAEGTPQTVGATATFMNNLFALNDTAVGLMTNAPITFVNNAVIENMVSVEALSGSLNTAHGGAPTPGQATTPGSTDRRAEWAIAGRGNYWSDYRGYDRDGDGVGDVPYRPEPPFLGAMKESPDLKAFRFTLAQQALDTAARMFPVYRYDPVIEDAGPLMSPPGPALPAENGVNVTLLATSALLLLLAGAVLVAVLDFDPMRLLGRRTRLGWSSGGGTR